MPVTFYTSGKRARPVRSVPATDSEHLRNSTWRYSTARRCGAVLQSSFNSKGSHARNLEIFTAHKAPQDALDLSTQAVYPVSHGNGFVDTAIIAYNEHHHLVIRPDDVWMSILSQFNIYVNTNAERLRHLFIQDEGKRVLSLDIGATEKAEGRSPSLQVDFGVLSRGMTDLIQNNVLDPKLRDWILPAFSTTTETDKFVAFSITMATIKQYFAYKSHISCGIPAITLLGDRDDWELLCSKAKDLLKYDSEGGQMATWYKLLNPVLKRFVSAFDTEKEGYQSRKARASFWQRIANVNQGESEPIWISGWITAFCCFGSDGRMLHSEETTKFNETLVLDGVRYHWVLQSKVPPAFGEVEVLLKVNEKEVNTLLVVGLVAFHAYFREYLRTGVIDKDEGFCSEGDSGFQDSPLGKGFDSVQTVCGWWLVEKVAEEKK